MNFTSLTLGFLGLIIMLQLVLTLQIDSNGIEGEIDGWNKWLEENKENKKYKFKKYKQKIKMVESRHDEVEVIGAMKFLQMYRSNHRGEFADEIDLLKEFFLQSEHIERIHFIRLATVWLHRHQFEIITGRKYVEQEHVVKKYKRQNARKFANEELRKLPIEQIEDMASRIFDDDKVKFSIVETVHWLYDQNMYNTIGKDRVTKIFKDFIDVRPPVREEMAELNEGPPGMDFIPEEKLEFFEDVINKIDL